MENMQRENFYQQIIELFENAKKNLSTAVNVTMVYSYYEAGRMIVEEEQQGKERAEYGKYILRELSERLTRTLGRGFSYDNLKLMRKFYLVYSKDSIGETAFPQSEKLPVTKEGRKFYLSWSHYIVLMRISNVEERHFYEIEAYRNGWSKGELARQYGSSLYERLALSRNKEEVMRLAIEGQPIENPKDIFKDPYVLEFTGLPELVTYSETELENKIIDNLQKFLLELGRGFTFVGRQVRFTFEEEHFRVDLVFYNRLLRCFVLFDLKIGQLKHQDIGQMQMYVNYYDRKVKLDDENPTVGIIICKDKKDAIVEMTLPKDNNQIFASQYQTVLPSKEELRMLLNEKDIE
ncbi:PDDEXK nuclease domain-containing protein [Bariatricus sp. SGI.161]|uniref:PDDEXK nuclease domain-containing protein n=1 Tax=Bariatricus sp. SGI.161 TaxID=3420550 RepID=UPI003CFDA335